MRAKRRRDPINDEIEDDDGNGQPIILRALKIFVWVGMPLALAFFVLAYSGSLDGLFDGSPALAGNVPPAVIAHLDHEYGRGEYRVVEFEEPWSFGSSFGRDLRACRLTVVDRADGTEHETTYIKPYGEPWRPARGMEAYNADNMRDD